MKATKLIAATAGTISVIGAVTFVFAQSTPSDAVGHAPTSPSTQSAPMDSNMSSNRGGSGTMTTPPTGIPMDSIMPSNRGGLGNNNTPSAGNMGNMGTGSSAARPTMPNDTSTIGADRSAMPIERLAQADRN